MEQRKYPRLRYGYNELLNIKDALEYAVSNIDKHVLRKIQQCEPYQKQNKALHNLIVCYEGLTKAIKESTERKVIRTVKKNKGNLKRSAIQLDMDESNLAKIFRNELGLSKYDYSDKNVDNLEELIHRYKCNISKLARDHYTKAYFIYKQAEKEGINVRSIKKQYAKFRNGVKL